MFKRKLLKFLGPLLLALIVPFQVSAQLWSGILAPARGGQNWQQAGADPTYVNENRTQCGTTIAAYGSAGTPASAATINTAIANCASAHPLSGVGGYVQLGAGNFFLNTQWNLSSNVTVRGMGANQTFVFLYNTTSSCPFSGGADICISTNNPGFGYDDNADTNCANWTPALNAADNCAGWTAGYAQGTTTITIGTFLHGAMSNWQVGSIIFLDQVDQSNTSPPTSGLAVCRNGSCGGGNVSGRPNRSLTEPQVITSISGTGPWTVGITPGIRMPSWFTSGSTPQVWGNSGLAIQRVGIENMSIDNSNALNVFSTVQCIDCYNVWIKGVRFSDTHGDTETGQNGFYQFYPVQSMRVTMRDSYIYGSPPVSNYYAMSCWTSGDELYENNIRQHMAFGFMAEGCINWVHAYNFDIDDYYTHCHGCSLDAQWQQASSYRHGGTDALGLHEGDVGIGVIGDQVFGASDLITDFRNQYNGRDPNGGSSGGKSEQTNAVLLYPFNRIWNIVGNVLGTGAYHDTYSCLTPSSAGHCGDNSAEIYSLGYVDGSSCTGTCQPDVYVGTGLMKWGNYDTVSNAVRWCGNSGNTGWSTTCGSVSEVPTGLTDGFSNSVPSTQTLPSSFYLNSKPSWWIFPSGNSSTPWPGIGPDITGGNITAGTGTSSTLGGHAYLNPAANCYLNVMSGPTNGAATLLSFNATTCYGSGLLPPTNLKITPGYIPHGED
jgi:hypothetical protein